MRGVGVFRCWCALLLVLCVAVPVPVPVSAQTSGNDYSNQATVDRLSARSARVQFLYLPTTSIKTVLIQYTNVSSSFSVTRAVYDNNIANNASAAGDREVVLTQVVNVPLTSYTLRNLSPATNYLLRVAWIDNLQQVQGTAPVTTFTTPALSTNTALSSLLASGGCGQLIANGSSSTLYYLTPVNDGSTNTIYSCAVVAEIANVTLAIVPQHAYASINTATQPALTATNTTLTVTSAYVDPLVQYSTTLTLNATGVTNFSWTVTSEAGTTQTYILSITRATPSSSAQVNGPAGTVTALLQATPTPSVLSYRALLWSSTAVGSWKVWSDDFVTFPFSALNISSSGPGQALATVLVSPAAASVPDGACSNVNVALFDQAGRSSWTSTCVSALYDVCTSTPFGAATTWQTPFSDAQADLLSSPTLYYPAPPVPWFPAA